MIKRIYSGEYLDFLGLPIRPRFATGLFSWRDLPALELFVRKHPSYHVVSLPRRGLTVNHVVPTARLYRLADGDQDPSLVCIWTDCFLQEWTEELGNRSSAKSR